jgi:hypothetical protein
MNYRADLYAAGDRFIRTERFDASNPVEAVEIIRQWVFALCLDHAVLYACDGTGLTQHVAKVGAER